MVLGVNSWNRIIGEFLSILASNSCIDYFPMLHVVEKQSTCTQMLLAVDDPLFHSYGIWIQYLPLIGVEPHGRRLSFALGRILCVLCYTGEQFVQSDIICMVESYVSCDVNSLVSRLSDLLGSNVTW